jgi:hypothetical protein|nr:MAG TPA: hypothetical protein [Bacteriophage sp.]
MNEFWIKRGIFELPSDVFLPSREMKKFFQKKKSTVKKNQTSKINNK